MKLSDRIHFENSLNSKKKQAELTTFVRHDKT